MALEVSKAVFVAKQHRQKDLFLNYRNLRRFPTDLLGVEGLHFLERIYMKWNSLTTLVGDHPTHQVQTVMFHFFGSLQIGIFFCTM